MPNVRYRIPDTRWPSTGIHHLLSGNMHFSPHTVLSLPLASLPLASLFVPKHPFTGI